MKKIIYILSVFVIVILTGLSASAMGDLTEDISDTIFSAINSDTLEILERFGISDLDSENIFNVSFKNIFEYYKDVFSELQRPKKERYDDQKRSKRGVARTAVRDRVQM